MDSTIVAAIVSAVIGGIFSIVTARYTHHLSERKAQITDVSQRPQNIAPQSKPAHRLKLIPGDQMTNLLFVLWFLGPITTVAASLVPRDYGNLLMIIALVWVVGLPLYDHHRLRP